MQKILTIAGSDSGGGAGIQADLKTITVFGGYGLSVITALTAQNTLGVQGVQLTPPEFVAAQLEAVLADIGADAAKTGMLGTAAIIEAVAAGLAKYQVPRLVVDPVMIAKSGDKLLADEAVAALKSRLLPLTYLLTPNLPEAEVILGRPVQTEADMVEAARALAGLGPQNVLVKGGHLAGRPVDILFDGENIHRFEGERIESQNTHGTGCTLSAALATLLAQGYSVREAVGRAKRFISRAIAAAEPLGQGNGPTNHLAELEDRLAKGDILESLRLAVSRLEAEGSRNLAPEISSQLVCALPHARGPEDVAGILGRIVRFGPGLKAGRLPGFRRFQPHRQGGPGGQAARSGDPGGHGPELFRGGRGGLPWPGPGRRPVSTGPRSRPRSRPGRAPPWSGALMTPSPGWAGWTRSLIWARSARSRSSDCWGRTR